LSGSHAHALYFHGHSAVHRLPGAVKLAALFVYVLAVVATPPTFFPAMVVHVAVLLTALAFSELPVGFFLRRLLVDIPFVLFALFLPLVGTAPHIEVGFLSLSVPGLYAAWNIIVKATLGVGASVIVGGTTEVPEIVAGLERLRVPRLMTAIISSMVRYMEVVGDEFKRARIAMDARGFRARWLGHARPLATSAGALFIRSYERGERVYQAMAARGFTGHMPDLEERGPISPGQWATGLAPAAVSLVAAAAALLLT
jgi:cobalt/nickel transport system permease protein